MTAKRCFFPYTKQIISNFKSENEQIPTFVHDEKIGIFDPDLSNVLPFVDIFKKKGLKKVCMKTF